MKLPDNQVQYVDSADVSETFVDSLNAVMFDGQTGRIELCVTRMEPPTPSTPPKAKRYPACRLVLTPEAFLKLASQLQQLLGALEKDGVVQKIQKNINEYKH
ncbi:MAG TPA: hypothetical protein PKJ37_02385 [Acidobacteriota bacterium]|nr:hypothetical protein [Acidobacteriota bacterium]